MSAFQYLDKDGAIFRVKPGEYPLRAAELFDPRNSEWVPYKGSLFDLAREGTPIDPPEQPDQ